MAIQSAVDGSRVSFEREEQDTVLPSSFSVFLAPVLAFWHVIYQTGSEPSVKSLWSEVTVTNTEGVERRQRTLLGYINIWLDAKMFLFFSYLEL